jgi:hypothetical protein
MTDKLSQGQSIKYAYSSLVTLQIKFPFFNTISGPPTLQNELFQAFFNGYFMLVLTFHGSIV